jgi:hypothetical protein
MEKWIAEISKRTGAKHVGKLPDVGGGAFGMGRLAKILHDRLAPSAGKRPGRPTNANWSEHRKVPMSEETLSALQQLSEALSTSERKVSPMQLAAQLLEESVVQVARRSKSRRKTAAQP